MNRTYIYKVADLSFSLTIPADIAIPEVLGQYEPFLQPSPSGDISFSMEVEYDSAIDKRISQYKMQRFNDEAPFIWLDTEGEALVAAGFSNSCDSASSVFEPTAADLSSSTLYLPEGASARQASFQINNALMLAYTCCASSKSRLMVHASVIVCDDKGYIFLGRSGTGKSTHARLWLKFIEGTQLLNDDNPVVYLKDGDVYVSGSPWSGKTPCYINREYPLKGIVRLSQAPYNNIQKLRGIQAYAAFLPSCSCMKWNRNESSNIEHTVEETVMQVPVYHLECLPDADAAKVCNEMIHIC